LPQRKKSPYSNLRYIETQEKYKHVKLRIIHTCPPLADSALQEGVMLKVDCQSGRFTPWNETCPKKYLSFRIPVVPLWKNSYNLSCAIPLEICNSNIRFFQKLHQRSVRGAFLRLFLWSATGNPVAPLGSTDSLRELLDLVARHPARLA